MRVGRLVLVSAVSTVLWGNAADLFYYDPCRGGDNYSDQPVPLGGGGARIACGVAK